jgi:hypothetical protein
VRGKICEGNGVRNSGMRVCGEHAFTCGQSRVSFLAFSLPFIKQTKGSGKRPGRPRTIKGGGGCLVRSKRYGHPLRPSHPWLRLAYTRRLLLFESSNRSSPIKMFEMWSCPRSRIFSRSYRPPQKKGPPQPDYADHSLSQAKLCNLRTR